MSTRIVAALLLTACTSAPPAPIVDHPTADFAALTLGEQVPQDIVDDALAELSDCLGMTVDIGDWTVWLVTDSMDTCTEIAPGVFALGFECGLADGACENYPPPDGKTVEQCPCVCSGLADAATHRIALAPDLRAINHELLHALGYVHADADFARCE